jgi:hypothetical protein
LCHAALCNAALCHAALCHAALCHAALFHGTRLRAQSCSNSVSNTRIMLQAVVTVVPPLEQPCKTLATRRWWWAWSQSRGAALWR